MRTRRVRARGARGVRMAAVAVVVVLVATSVALALRFGRNPGAVESPVLGRQAPADQLPRLEGGGSVALRDLRGHPVVLNFWASWCFECRAEHAALLRAATAYGDQGVRVLGVVYQDSPSAARSFLDKYGRGYDVLTDPKSRAAIDFGLFGVPETFFLDRHGRIVAKIAGRVDDETLRDAIEHIATAPGRE